MFQYAVAADGGRRRLGSPMALRLIPRTALRQPRPAAAHCLPAEAGALVTGELAQPRCNFLDASPLKYPSN